MNLAPYLADLDAALARTGAAGDDETRRTAALLAAALEPAARLALLTALSDLAAEVTDRLAGPVVEVRLDGRDVAVVVTDRPEPDESAPEPAALEVSGETSRVTLRLPEELKIRAEEAAGAQGVSLNTWLVRSVQESLERRGRRSGLVRSRISGWVVG
ncbi:toxin-antitoxin system HicB family antitoxin [Micromonospora sp. WMMD558]|uniref:toxin-antitoxin system HicB family antitoxin n=1 Tax=unclassified Micromonospora TaxID=2617518 RepID=UPI0012B4DB05|nr:toxin-antitoxin system HicB family antitoxin [Micromonospora sp. WMMC415]QGN49914.1 toxin-antitoxin system HicB family antitoxin [Micromonospora sp. WMMC415]